MTWIVGVCSLDTAAIFGDTAVSYGAGAVGNGYGVQKIFLLSELAAVGFAGVVHIGFAEVRRLERVARSIGPRAEAPEILAAWHGEALDRYRTRYASHDRGRGCDFIILSATDQQSTGVLDDGRSIVMPFSFSPGFVVRMPRADEKAQPVEKMNLQATSIGSGAEQPSYVEAIKKNAQDTLLHSGRPPRPGPAFPDGTPGAPAPPSMPSDMIAWLSHQLLTTTLRIAVRDKPVEGVSDSFLGAIMRRDGWRLSNVTYEFRDGEATEASTPPLASNISQLRALEQQYGLPAQAGVAMA